MNESISEVHAISASEMWRDRKDEQGDWVHSKRKKLPSGMTAEVGYWLFENGDAEVFFTIYTKRNKRWPANHKETTGVDGLAPAMWALHALAEMETHRNVKRIIVFGTDARRSEIYTKILPKRGYEYMNYCNTVALAKNVNQ